MEISDYLFVLLSFALISLSGCFGPSISGSLDSDNDGLSDDIEIQTGTDPNDPDSDADGMNDGDEANAGRDPSASDIDNSVADDLQPYGKPIYSVGPTMGAYGNDGVATYTWTFSDQNGYRPSERKFACVTPTDLPDEFWDKYDTREALMDQDDVDKKADNLYVPFNKDGAISFSLNTYRIQGKYSFKICGILDENYMDEVSYSGDGDEISVEVKEKGLVVVDKQCILLEKTEYTESYGCYWEIEHADGSEFKCGHLVPAQPYGEVTRADGTTHNALFEIILEQGGVEDRNAVLSSVRTGSSIHRSDTWTLCDFGMPCGCCKHPNFKYAKDKNGLCIKKTLREGGSETLSISVNGNHFIYEGDGDPITVSYSG